MNNPNPNQAFEPVVNRIADVAIHTTRYAFKGLSRLAKDAGINPSTLSCVVRGISNPSFATVIRLTTALEKELGRKIDPRDLMAEGGRYPTPFVCDLCQCRGCLPENATDEFGDRKPAFQDVRPGKWVSSKHPRGFLTGGIHE